MDVIRYCQIFTRLARPTREINPLVCFFFITGRMMDTRNTLLFGLKVKLVLSRRKCGKCWQTFLQVTHYIYTTVHIEYIHTMLCIHYVCLRAHILCCIFHAAENTAFIHMYTILFITYTYFSCFNHMPLCHAWLAYIFPNHVWVSNIKTWAFRMLLWWSIQ